MSQQPTPKRHRRRLAAFAGSCVLVMTGCATDGSDDPAGGDGVIDSGAIDAVELAGVWEFTDGTDEAGALVINDLSDDPLTLDIDITQAVVRGKDQCQTVFGSLTASVDGASTFTMPGSTTAPCADPLEAEHLRTVAALEAVTRWESTDPGLVLTGPGSLRLVFRPAG